MKKLLDSLVKVETVLASVILAALILCTFSGVLARYCFSAPFTWEEEFQLACMVWITFLAAPVAFHTKSHVAIEILVDAFPKKVQRVMEICIFILMGLFGCRGHFPYFCWNVCGGQCQHDRSGPPVRPHRHSLWHRSDPFCYGFHLRQCNRGFYASYGYSDVCDLWRDRV